MTRVLVLFGGGPGRPATAAAAEVLADVLGSDPVGLRCSRSPGGGVAPADLPTFPVTEQVGADALAAALAAARSPDIDAVAVGASDRFPTPAGARPLMTELASSLAAPLLVVPPHSRLGVDVPLRRVMMAHDGSPRMDDHLRPMATRFGDAGVDVIALHVLDPAAGASVIEDAAHGLAAWQHEFQLRHLVPEERLEVRLGSPAERVRQGPREFGADVVLLAWGQDLATHAARVIRASLDDPRVPVLLVPAPAG